ncbi:MAG: prepilin-type N-terminal cleavage/methylation domain-containing protein [Deltaproteobacteria bacterium]|nr:prepilin-type N-terminal cleavage/methylation domain-containing protein [Deltaproteobacteria bacterium]
MRKSGFTLIELMVAMVVGLTAVTSVYSLGAAMSEQFYREQRTATSQGASRAAIMELRRDISRAGLFGSPNAQNEARCEAGNPTLPTLGGGNTTMGAFQYYPDADLLSVLDPDGDNFPRVSADRLRVLTSLYLTDQLLVDSVSPEGTTVILQTGNQAYRRTFAWGQAAGAFTGPTPDYLEGTLGWDAAWGGESASWNGIGQKGARAFQTSSVLHIESPEGYHFFRTVYGKQDNVQNQVRLFVNPALPVATACLPGAGEGSTVAPLQWVEYALVNPFDAALGGNFMDFGDLFFFDLEGTNPLITTDFENAGPEALREQRNVMLVRRILNPADGTVRTNTTQVLAEFVSNFEVSFLVDRASGTAMPPVIETEADPTVINSNPEQVRSVLIELGIRSPLEDPSIPYSGVTDANTRFEVNPNEKGSARVRHLRIEIPVMSVARRNL